MSQNNSTPQEINIANPNSPLAFPSVPPQDDKCGNLAADILDSDNKLSEKSNEFFNKYLDKAQGNMPNCETTSAKAAIATWYGAAAASFDQASGCQNVAIQAALNQNLNTSINCTNNTLRSETALRTNQDNQATIEIVADTLRNSSINMSLDTKNTAEVLNVGSASVQQEIAKQMQAGINNFQKQAQENYDKPNSLFKTNDNSQPNQSVISSTNQILNKSVDIVNQETIGRIVAENFQSANGTLKINAGLIEGVDLNISSDMVNEVLLTNIVNGVIGQIFKGTTMTDLANVGEGSSKNVTTSSGSVIYTIIMWIFIIGAIAGGIWFGYKYYKHKNSPEQLRKRKGELQAKNRTDKQQKQLRKINQILNRKVQKKYPNQSDSQNAPLLNGQRNQNTGQTNRNFGQNFNNSGQNFKNSGQRQRIPNPGQRQGQKTPLLLN